MSSNLSIHPTRSAILSMDLQSGIVSMLAASDPGLVPRVAGVLKQARAAGITVIHVQVGFRPGLPEVSRRNPIFAAVLNSPQHQQLFEGPAGAIHPSLGPEPGDIVVTKHRVSAFHGTDLEMILRAKEIDTLILLGIATSGVVLSTLVDASDADYRLFVVGDCCLDPDPDLHISLTGKCFPRRGTVVTAAEVSAMLNS
ncbi:MAG TPA: isochorismatase family cysteine hydrolase [Acidobacteriaceae bacterium]|jgi:nicotinamidase-related amidase|nr:isochorismatase family cysteine hydrolase [Acidobacteriaceae bacterium]